MTEGERIAKLIDEAERTLLALQDGSLPQGDLPGLCRAIGQDWAGARCEDDFTPSKIPTFDEAVERINHGNGTPLDKFIFNNEPVSNTYEQEFRQGLQDVIDFVLSHKGSAE